MKHRRWLWIAGTGVLCAALLCTATSELVRQVDTLETVISRPTVVVDAGHGGFDGGAEAPDGTQEKDLNLAISRPLGMMLTLCGFDVIMTRTEDQALHQQGDTIREKKVSDMDARLSLYEQAQFNISIHQNMFGMSSCQGSQVFYSDAHPLSEVLATCVREEIVRTLQPENTRQLKAGNRDIFLLHKTSKPTVLVECGFLSNADELSRLKTEEYQRRLAFAVVCGAVRYTTEGGESF